MSLRGCVVWTLVTGSRLLCAWLPLPWKERAGAPSSGCRSLGAPTHHSQGLGVFEFNDHSNTGGEMLGERVTGKY